jgi:hypothetical protein
MNDLKTFLLTLGLLAVGTAACSDDASTTDTVDMGPSDLGPEDLGDSTMVAPRVECPTIGQGFPVECVNQADCDTPNEEVNCDFCPPFNGTNQCLRTDEGYACVPTDNSIDLVTSATLRFRVTSVLNAGLLGSLVPVVLQGETTGGRILTCEDDVYPDPEAFDFTAQCLNVIDTRPPIQPIVEGADTVSVTVGGFPVGGRILALVYAFESGSGRGSPIALFCTDHQLPEGERTVVVPNLPGFDDMVLFED